MNAGAKYLITNKIGTQQNSVLLQDTPSLEELKLKYYQLLIRYHSHNNSYIDICRCYKAIYETDSIADDPAKWQPVS